MNWQKIGERIKEPSTGLGIAGIFGLFLPEVAPFVPDLFTWIGTGIGLGLAIVNVEKGAEVARG